MLDYFLEEKTNLILYFGAFDPFHLIHFYEVYFASISFDALVYIVPVLNSPEKPELSDLTLRCKVIEASIEKNLPYLQCVPEETQGISRKKIAPIYERLFYTFELMGIDDFQGLEKIPYWQEIINRSHLIVTGTENPNVPLPDFFDDLYKRCPIPHLLTSGALGAGKEVSAAFVNQRTQRFIYYLGFASGGLSSTMIRQGILDKTYKEFIPWFVNEEAARIYIEAKK